MEAHILDKIEKYLNGKMTAQEEKAFDLAIESDAGLARAVVNFGESNGEIELSIEDNLRVELANLKSVDSANSAYQYNSINKNEPVAEKRNLVMFVLPVITSVALLLAYLGINWAEQNYANKALGLELYERYELPKVSIENNIIHPFSEGLTAFQNKQYDQAISFFNGIVVDAPQYPEAQFYLGHAYLASENFKEAAKQFEKVVNLKDDRNIEQAEWHQIMAQLSSGQTTPNFETLIAEITRDKEHTFNQQAIELQNKLNTFWRKLTF